MSDLPFLDHPLRTHEEVIERAREIGQARGLARVVVAAAEEEDVLAAMYACKQEKIAEAVLVGNRKNIETALETANVPGDAFELMATESDEESASRAAELAAAGKVDIVMKGFLKTSVLLKTLLKHDSGLRDRELVSHSAVLYVPRYQGFLNVTDGGTLVRPLKAQKITVIANAYPVMRSLGIARPRIAVLGPSTVISDRMPETRQAKEIVDLVRKDWSEYLDIEGPLTIEDVINRSQDHFPSQLNSSKPDVLLVHTIEEGNITAKTLIQFGGAVFMGVIAGAKVPISLVSRSDSMLNKLSSVALAVCLSDYQRRGFPPLPAIHL